MISCCKSFMSVSIYYQCPGGEVADFGMNIPEDGVWTLARLCVPKKERGNGVARKMVEKMIEVQEENDAILIMGINDVYGGLDVWHFASFLERCGFIKVYSSKDGCLLMRFPQSRQMEQCLKNMDYGSLLAKTFALKHFKSLNNKCNKEVYQHIEDIKALNRRWLA